MQRRARLQRAYVQPPLKCPAFACNEIEVLWFHALSSLSCRPANPCCMPACSGGGCCCQPASSLCAPCLHALLACLASTFVPCTYKRGCHRPASNLCLHACFHASVACSGGGGCCGHACSHQGLFRPPHPHAKVWGGVGSGCRTNRE